MIHSILQIVVGVVLASGLALAESNALTDVCTQSRFLTHSELNGCINQIPYNSTDKIELINYYRASLPQYVFDNISNTSYPFGPYKTRAVDLKTGLTKIESTKYENDAKMQHAFYTLFRKLRDAHTTHSKPFVYYKYYAFQPLSIMSIADKNEQVIRVLSVDSSEIDTYNAIYNSTKGDFDVEGWNIVEIDGVPAMEAMKGFANNNIGLLKDDGARFNLAVSGYKTGRGWFVFRSMGQFDVPTNSSVEYTLVHPKTNEKKKVSYNWVGMNLGLLEPTYTSRDQQYKTLLQRLLQLYIDHELYIKPDAVEYIDSFSPKAGVLRINSFSKARNEDSTSFIKNFAKNVTKAITSFTRSNKEKLIIDLTGNGGGNICLGYALLNYLFPHRGVLTNEEAVYRARNSPLHNIFAIKSAEIMMKDPKASPLLDPRDYFSAKTRRQLQDASWMTSPEDTVLGKMSQGVFFHCTSSLAFREFPGSNVYFNSSNLIVVSQGYCGSTCAVFASYIQAHKLAKTVALGGFLNVSQQIFGYPGGEVGNATEYTEFAKELKSDPVYQTQIAPLVPHPPTSGQYDSFKFTYLSISPWNKDGPNVLPLEYTYMPANYSIMYPGDPLNYSSIYHEVLRIAT